MVQQRNSFMKNHSIIGFMEKLRPATFSYREKARIINMCFIGESGKKINHMNVYRYETGYADSVPHPDKLTAYVQSEEFAELVRNITDTLRQPEKHQQAG